MNILPTSRMTLLLCLGFAPALQAEDWPQWLGPRRDGVWREDGIIDKFPANGPPLRWKTKLGGGYSGPAVAAGRVFVMDRQAPDTNLADAKLLHDGPPPRNIYFLRKRLPGVRKS